MARIARVVVPKIPHHIIQRGNRRQEVFFCREDYEIYISLIREWCDKSGVQIWAYCLMPNHIHLIATPETKEVLSRGIGEAHRRYTKMINFRQGWRGYLWQGRFASFPMDKQYLMAAIRYIELNPSRAKMVSKPWEYEWSSARAHVEGKDDKLVKVKAVRLLKGTENWKEFLLRGIDENEMEELRRHEHTGQPLGEKSFISKIENQIDRIFQRKKSGPKGPWKNKEKVKS